MPDRRKRAPPPPARARPRDREPRMRVLLLGAGGNAANKVAPAAIVARCQDKLACAEALGGLAPATHALDDGPTAVERALRRHGAIWLRLRRGSGSVGALPTGSATMAESWVAHWAARRGHD